VTKKQRKSGEKTKNQNLLEGSGRRFFLFFYPYVNQDLTRPDWTAGWDSRFSSFRKEEKREQKLSCAGDKRTFLPYNASSQPFCQSISDKESFICFGTLFALILAFRLKDGGQHLQLNV